MWSILIINVQQIFYVVQFTMSFCVTIFVVSEILFPFIFLCLQFRYHYLSASLYLFAISVVIVKNNLENKIIYVLSLSNTLCIKFFPYYHLII
jgi:hypothetical protein